MIAEFVIYTSGLVTGAMILGMYRRSRRKFCPPRLLLMVDVDRIKADAISEFAKRLHDAGYSVTEFHARGTPINGMEVSLIHGPLYTEEP